MTYLIVLIIVYIMIAALCVFGLSVAKVRAMQEECVDLDFLFAPCVAAVIWPVGLPIYGAYLAVYWFLYNYPNDEL